MTRRVRALGIDLGSKRIGLATSDSSGTLASPYSVLKRRSRRADHQAIAQIVESEEVEIVVVGLPLTLNGERGQAAQAAIAEAEQLATVVGVPVELHDERLTTVTAANYLREVPGPRRRTMIDAAAAAVILQSWLESGQ
jgi:putative Holliday junction resolvase